MTQAEDNRPKWMVELEDRKRKPRLAHEAGAGSPCLSCKEACPGLDLHFWRKICKNCKCGRDEHDVDDDDFPQFDLLLGPPGKPRKKATFLRVANKKQPDKEIPFEWVPPDTTKELATDYMRALPEDKLPIKGSAGAALRKQQLQKQLPLHDIDHKACDELSDLERQQFEKYLENLKKYVGQGKVTKVMGARPFSRSLMTPANAADMQPMSPQRTPMSGQPGNLRIPSSFVPKVPPPPPLRAVYNQQKGWQANIEPLRAQQSDSINSTNIQLGQYHHSLGNIAASGQIANSGLVSGTYNPAQQFADLGHLSNENESAVHERNISNLPTAQDVHLLANVSNVEAQSALARSGTRVESSPGRYFAQEGTVSSGTYNPAQHFARPNVSSVDSDVLGTLEGSYEPNQQVGHLDSVANSRNIAHGSQLLPGQYHDARLLLSQVPESIGQNVSGGTLHPGYSQPTGNLANIGNQPQTGNLDSAMNRDPQFEKASSTTNAHLDVNPISRDLVSSDEMSMENARLAEQMLSDALLPPSAVHAKEIIGSTLDRNKLEFIQQHLANKYSKDDPAMQTLLRSQQIASNEPQYTGGLNKIEESPKKALSVDKEAERIAIIAAMRNPSGLLAENQKSAVIGSQYANPSKEEGSILRSDSNVCKDQDRAVPWGSQNINSRTGNVGNTGLAPQFGRDQQVQSPSGNARKSIGQLGQNPMQQGYLDDLNSALNSLESIPLGQQRYMDKYLQGTYSTAHGQPLDSLSPERNTALKQRSGNHGSSPIVETHPQGTLPPIGVSDDLTAALNSIESIPLGQQRYMDQYPQGIYNTAQGQPLDGLSPERNTALQQRSDIHGPNPIVDTRSQSILPPIGVPIPTQQLRAELSHQSINPKLIHSESLRNPVFPEGSVEAPGLMQNPPSVDQLRGALGELALGPVQVHKCHQCKEGINAGDVVVTAEKAEDAVWHPGCFICSTCNELLADLVYFYHKGKLYCGRDLAALLNIPRCFACDELIFVREYTVAEGHNYHVKHFCCWDCDEPLAGQQYISENDRPLCLPCFQKTYAKTCITCNKVIKADEQGVAVKDLDFHATDTCFCCFTCKKSLLSGRMAIKENRPFCSKECITEFQSKRP